MFIIQASNIHESGGKVLLIELIAALCNDLKSHGEDEHLPFVTIFVDKRFEIYNELQNFPPRSFHVIEVQPTMLKRFLAEVKLWWLARSNLGATVFCFGNLPPLLPLKNNVIMYFHTVLYFKRFNHVKPSKKLKLKHFIERQWLRWGLRSVKEILVQSNFVKDCFEAEFNFNRIKVLPFAVREILEIRNTYSEKDKKSIDFIYLAAATPHKNHKNLFEAWSILAQENIFPNLHVTIDPRYKELLSIIEQLREQKKVSIINHELVSHSKAMELYREATAAIFPSICESFGLPLLEAYKMGLPVLASESDYVRDVLDPIETFDPMSAKSIARAVKRFLNLKDEKKQVYTASDLSSYLCSKNSSL